MLVRPENRKVCNTLGIGENKMKYKVRWVEMTEYEVVVEADSREDAINEATLNNGAEVNETGWHEWEADSIEVDLLEKPEINSPFWSSP